MARRGGREGEELQSDPRLSRRHSMSSAGCASTGTGLQLTRCVSPPGTWLFAGCEHVSHMFSGPYLLCQLVLVFRRGLLQLCDACLLLLYH